MGLSNKEIQLNRNCQLYKYLLEAQLKEVPEYIEECAEGYDADFLVDCVQKLAQEIESLDDQTFSRILENENSLESKNLLEWWNMYKLYIPIKDSL